MEPARQGRDDLTDMELMQLAAMLEPQWSPPVRGGTTGTNPNHETGISHAAMEPARQGRDDGIPHPRHAMTLVRRNGARPSGAGRPGPRCSRLASDYGGNGARPSGAGRPGSAVRTAQSAAMPQWSPPVRGGTTGRAHLSHMVNKDAAMEP